MKKIYMGLKWLFYSSVILGWIFVIACFLAGDYFEEKGRGE